VRLCYFQNFHFQLRLLLMNKPFMPLSREEIAIRAARFWRSHSGIGRLRAVFACPALPFPPFPPISAAIPQADHVAALP
jgi:hypothetical protein